MTRSRDIRVNKYFSASFSSTLMSSLPQNNLQEVLKRKALNSQTIQHASPAASVGSERKVRYSLQTRNTALTPVQVEIQTRDCDIKLAKYFSSKGSAC